jgi:hypothetical protein
MLKKLHASPFEKALASMAVQDDRMVQAEQMKRAESNPIRRAVLAPVSAAERLGLEVGTTPQKIGLDKAIGEQGVLGFTDDKRLTQGEYLQQRQPAHAVSAEYLREQRLFHFKKPHNSVERALGRAEELHADPTTIDEVLSSQKVSSRDQLEAASEESFPVDAESPDRKRDGEHVIGEPAIPNRLTSYLGEHGTAGDIERYARGEGGGSLHEQGELLSTDEELESGSPIMGRAALSRSEGLLGERAAEPRQESTILRGRGRPRLEETPKRSAARVRKQISLTAKALGISTKEVRSQGLVGV